MDRYTNLRQRLVSIGQDFYRRSWVMGTSGNFSAVASSRPLKLLMTPSGAHKGRLKASDLLLVDAQGRVKAGTRKPSAETLLHLEIIRAHGAGAVLVKRHPDLLTQEFIKVDRGGRIFVDTGRNAPGATFAAVYAVRPKPGAPVSAPCTWPEVERGAVGPRTFTLRTLAARLADVGDLWRDTDGARAALDGSLRALEGLLSAEDWAESAAATTRRPTSRKRASPRKKT